MNRRRVILIFVDWYEPGFKAGGPIRSISNFVSCFKDILDIYIYTSDRDMGDSESYRNIEGDIWIHQNGYGVFYASPEKLTFWNIREIIIDINPDWIYLNGMFSWHYSILPVLMNFFSRRRKRLLLAPRGMLKKTALHFKKVKKTIFLNFYKLIDVQRSVIFQATSAEEALEIKKIFGSKSEVVLLPNLSSKQNKFVPVVDKVVGHLLIIFVGRIHPIKNLLILLKLLGEIGNENISLTVVGKIEDMVYWGECMRVIKEFKLKVNVFEEVVHAEIENKIIQHHLFVLLTQGENFGHAIYESLSCARPVLISDRTPWKNLADFHAGWEIDLIDKAKIKGIIEFVTQMNNEQLNVWTKGAWTYSQNYVRQSFTNFESYLKLFNN